MSFSLACCLVPISGKVSSFMLKTPYVVGDNFT